MKLKLNKETVQRLSPEDLRGVDGGAAPKQTDTSCNWWCAACTEQSRANGNYSCYWLASFTA